MERRPSDETRGARDPVDASFSVDRTPPARTTGQPAGLPMWAWILPLVLVVMLLAWFVATRGEPSPLFQGSPAVEVEPGPASADPIQGGPAAVEPSPAPAEPAAAPSPAPAGGAPGEP